MVFSNFIRASVNESVVYEHQLLIIILITPFFTVCGHFVYELVFVESHARDFKKYAPVLLVLYRIEIVEKL